MATLLYIKQQATPAAMSLSTKACQVSTRTALISGNPQNQGCMSFSCS